LRVVGSVHSRPPSASSTKFRTVLGAWSGKSRTTTVPRLVRSVAVRTLVIAKSCHALDSALARTPGGDHRCGQGRHIRGLGSRSRHRAIDPASAGNLTVEITHGGGTSVCYVQKAGHHATGRYAVAGHENPPAGVGTSPPGRSPEEKGDQEGQTAPPHPPHHGPD